MKTMMAAAAFLLAGAAWAEPDGEHCSCDHTHGQWNWDPRTYAGAALAQNSFAEWSFMERIDAGSYASRDLDDGGTGYRVFAGLEFLHYLAAELGYADFGGASFTGQSDGSGFFWDAGPQHESVDVEGIDLSLLARLPLVRDLAVVAQAGGLWSRAVRTLRGSTQSSGPFAAENTDDGTSFAYGGRLEYSGLLPLRLAVAYSHSEFEGGGFLSDPVVETWSLAAAYRF